MSNSEEAGVSVLRRRVAMLAGSAKSASARALYLKWLCEMDEYLAFKDRIGSSEEPPPKPH